MRVSELIIKLEEILDREGDIEVVSLANERIAPMLDVIGGNKPRYIPSTTKKSP